MLCIDKVLVDVNFRLVLQLDYEERIHSKVEEKNSIWRVTGSVVFSSGSW